MGERRVTVFGVHLDLSNSDLTEAMSIFGKVTGVKRQPLPNTDQWNRNNCHSAEMPYPLCSHNGWPASIGKLCRPTGDKVGHQASQCTERQRPRGRQENEQKRNEKPFPGTWAENTRTESARPETPPSNYGAGQPANEDDTLQTQVADAAAMASMRESTAMKDERIEATGGTIENSTFDTALRY